MELILGLYTDNLTCFMPQRVGGPKAGKLKLLLGRVLGGHVWVAITSPGLGMMPGGAWVEHAVNNM